MSVGLGIFFGLVFCGLIFLYTQTKDRWNWSKLKKIIFYVITIPLALGLLFAGGNYVFESYKERPKLLTEFAGVKLDETLKDAAFKVGDFQTIEGWKVSYYYDLLMESEKNSPDEEMYSKNWKMALDAYRKRPKNAIDGDYVNIERNLRISIKNHKVKRIQQFCNEGYDSQSLNSISCKSAGEEILEKFRNVRIQCKINAEKNDNTNRVYDVLKYGTRYYLNQNTVMALMLTKPDILKSYVGINWGKCD